MGPVSVIGTSLTLLLQEALEGSGPLLSGLGWALGTCTDLQNRLTQGDSPAGKKDTCTGRSVTFNRKRERWGLAATLVNRWRRERCVVARPLCLCQAGPMPPALTMTCYGKVSGTQ